MFIFHPEKLQNFSKLCFYTGGFSAEECLAITSLFSEEKEVVAGVHGDNQQKSEVRVSSLNWIENTPETLWIFEKLKYFIFDANKARYNFDLAGFFESLQLTKYEIGSHYTWHEDNMEPEFTTRKLSITVQLSNPDSYQGGDLTLYPNMQASRIQGTVSIFPSFALHRVTPVTKGTRYSLVGWVTGPSFR